MELIISLRLVFRESQLNQRLKCQISPVSRSRSITSAGCRLSYTVPPEKLGSLLAAELDSIHWLSRPAPQRFL